MKVMNGLDLQSQKIVNLADPSATTDAANKQYVDNVARGLQWKAPVRVATTTNGTLATAYANGQSIDGVVLATNDRILLKEAVYIPYANIIFDHDRTEALKIVRGYLDDVGIDTCGRYGEWGYFWTDDSIKSGEGAARKALARLGK